MNETGKRGMGESSKDLIADRRSEELGRLGGVERKYLIMVEGRDVKVGLIGD